jgi:octaprenyl-diphosphate synthase
LCAGELHQVCERGNLGLTEEAYFNIIDGKTAELTSCCCRLGALYSGAADEVVQSLADYGRCLGMAFQITDDLLDLVGEERSAGKSLGTDLELQKLTLPVIHFLRHGSADKTDWLMGLLQSSDKHQREILVPELASSGALDYARRRAERFAAEAGRHLACLPTSECKAVLVQLTDKVVHRDR